VFESASGNAVPNLRQLEYLVALADTLHFRRAAERTNTTQPTLSEQLKALEERLGAQLVERGGSRVVITAVGEQVVEIARRMLRDAQEIRSIASGSNGLAGLVRLAVPQTIGPYLFKHAAPLLQNTYPALQLNVREDIAQRLPRGLEEGQYDVIISPGPLRGAEIVTVPIFREPLVLTVSAKHPLAGASRVGLKELKGQHVLTLAQGHYLHESLQSLCAEAGATLRYDFEGTSLDMLREMVIMGLGITFMPGLYAARELVSDPQVHIIRLHDRSLHRTVLMGWRKSSARQEAFIDMADFFRRIARSIPEIGQLGTDALA
jgi:LysR family transcriptional regulator, hydrogen peroxide-inducible genes activator